MALMRFPGAGDHWLETLLGGEITLPDVLLYLQELLVKDLLRRRHLVDATDPGLRFEPPDARPYLPAFRGAAVHHRIGPIAVVVLTGPRADGVAAVIDALPALTIRAFRDHGAAEAWLHTLSTGDGDDRAGDRR